MAGGNMALMCSGTVNGAGIANGSSMLMAAPRIVQRCCTKLLRGWGVRDRSHARQSNFVGARAKGMRFARWPNVRRSERRPGRAAISASPSGWPLVTAWEHEPRSDTGRITPSARSAQHHLARLALSSL